MCVTKNYDMCDISDFQDSINRKKGRRQLEVEVQLQLDLTILNRSLVPLTLLLLHTANRKISKNHEGWPKLACTQKY